MSIRVASFIQFHVLHAVLCLSDNVGFTGRVSSSYSYVVGLRAPEYSLHSIDG